MQNDSMYKEHILELWKHPENFGKLKKKTHELRGFNQSCGDDVTINLLEKDGIVKDAKFAGTGCALCMASSSLLMEKIQGMKTKEVLKMSSKDILHLLEVEVHPARIKCITLSLETTKAALFGSRKNEKNFSETTQKVLKSKKNNVKVK